MRKAKHNEKNERIKHRYMRYLREAKRLSEASVDKALAAINQFEASAKQRSFSAFHIEQAVKFKRDLSELTNPITGKPLSKSTVDSVLKNVRAFFIWLADQPGYRSKIRYSDADYFNISNRDQRIARSGNEKPSPSLEQVLHVLRSMPSGTPIELRNRALVAFLLLTGVRDGATIGLKLKHVDLSQQHVWQDARVIATKFGKSMKTNFFPVGADVEVVFAGYVQYLKEELLWSPDDPLFPKTEVGRGKSGGFEAIGLQRSHWSSAQPIREIVKKSFRSIDMPEYGPHSFRKTLARLGEQLCTTPEEMKAWSQNLGHEDVLTTFRSYGHVPAGRQAEVIARLRSTK